MITSQYQTKENTITTSLMGGREHFAYRQPVRASRTYEYTLSYGQNFHSIAAFAFGDDAFWWVLSDMNLPIDGFRLKEGDIILLPEAIVRENRGLKKFF